MATIKPVIIGFFAGSMMSAYAELPMMKLQQNTVDLKAIAEEIQQKIEKEVYAEDPSLEDFNKNRSVRIIEQQYVDETFIEVPDLFNPQVRPDYQNLTKERLINIILELENKLLDCES